MKVTSIELSSQNISEPLVLSYEDTLRREPFNVKTITGLDADDIRPYYYGQSSLEPHDIPYYNLTLPTRNFVFRVELNPSFKNNESYSDLRDLLYRRIASSRQGMIDILFKNGENVVAKISGFIVKVEASHFTETPEVQITVRCDDPRLRAPDPVILTEFVPNVETIIVEDNVSTAPHGLLGEFRFVLESDVFGFSQENSYFWVTYLEGFLVNDILRFNSEIGFRSIELIRDSTTYQIADRMVVLTHWPVVFPGHNEFIIREPTSVIVNYLMYYPTYWGV